jgi:hypothetical protein
MDVSGVSAKAGYAQHDESRQRIYHIRNVDDLEAHVDREERRWSRFDQHIVCRASTGSRTAVPSPLMLVIIDRDNARMVLRFLARSPGCGYH